MKEGRAPGRGLTERFASVLVSGLSKQMLSDCNCNGFFLRLERKQV